jgi:hypothetical protein
LVGVISSTCGYVVNSITGRIVSFSIPKIINFLPDSEFHERDIGKTCEPVMAGTYPVLSFSHETVRFFSARIIRFRQ